VVIIVKMSNVVACFYAALCVLFLLGTLLFSCCLLLSRVSYVIGVEQLV